LLAQVPTPLPPVAPEGGTFWMPPAASTIAPHTDAVFYFIYTVSLFFFTLIVLLMAYFVFRYRRRVEGERGPGRTTHHTALELTWTAVPLVLVVLMFYSGFRGFMNLMNPPAGALDIRVLGQKWLWSFTYPNGHVDTELHVPVDTPVRLTLESNDVIHSFFIPAFRIKRDAVPGRYNRIWFQATRPGEYLALCAEYCGTQHSDMLARVVVHEPGLYEKWLAEAADPFRTRSLAEVGQLLVAKRCGGCHSVDGSANIGPTFKGIYEHSVTLADGSTVVADDNYIRESILEPRAKIVRGYEPVMPTFKGQLKDREITAIIEYIKALSDEATKPRSDEGTEQ
jgi:cytochrome c oxidase subunit 2